MASHSFRPYLAEADKLLCQGCVRDIVFSGGTYEVLVVDLKEKKEEWAFLQLDQEGGVRDFFCTCSKEDRGCVHLAAAYRRLIPDGEAPYHVRFESSLWNLLCRQRAVRVGYRIEALKSVESSSYETVESSCFQIKSKTREAESHLRDLFVRRLEESEETSIKFSNLSNEEIERWRQGRPTARLLYELSFWSDLAKWLFSLQERGRHCQVTFSYDSQDVPVELHATFEEVEVHFSLSEEEIESIIPALAGVKSDLSVSFSHEGAFQKAVYEKERAVIFLERVETPSKLGPSRKGERCFGDWRYKPRQGFFQVHPHPLWEQETISSEEIPRFFNLYGKELAKLLQGETVHWKPLEGHYVLSFDDSWNLHLRFYLFETGDLEKATSHDFGEWVYLEGYGFTRVEERLFSGVETLIPCQEVGEFVSSHRLWMHSQPGFTIHLASVASQLTYSVDKAGSLHFFGRYEELERTGRGKDFGDWLYLRGEGFYPKESVGWDSPFRAGTEVTAEELPDFLRLHREELSHISGFFCDAQPVEKSFLTVSLDRQEAVNVTPRYVLKDSYKNRGIRFFDTFLHIPGEGFHELPADLALPERFRRPLKLKGKAASLFLTFEMDLLKGYDTEIDPRLWPPARLALVATRVIPGKVRGLFSCELFYRSGKGDIPLTEIWEVFHRHHKEYFFSSLGLIRLDDPRFHWLKALEAHQVDLAGNIVLLSAMELIRLQVMEGLTVAGEVDERDATSTLLHELSLFQAAEEPDISGLKSHLRPYQMNGLRWLWFLYRHNLSGLLCDDMGLGKTHQAMALMAAIVQWNKQHAAGVKTRLLVVCPTSVICHWEEKLAEFLPGIKVYVFRGPGRNLEDYLKDYDLLLTSYGVWRMDSARLSEIPFDLAVFDELQLAKNRSSRLHGALRKAQATMRLGLTGTPIENRLIELKALFDLVLPSYMPSESAFRESFVLPIESGGDKQRQQMLSRLVHPFVLRRKKEEVLTDLPPKTVEIAHCFLQPDQERLYREVLEGSRSELFRELLDDSKPVPYLHVFAMLTALKQICNHPAVYLRDVENFRHYESGKWDLFLELLGEAQESGQKVVVFSQYLAMIDLIEIYLKQQGQEYAVIRGSTVNRREQLHRFNKEESCRVFIGSLQAIGLGVDLTAASVVIHYDRWWNAAREEQATDRVHRMGQTRGVQVFKLVTKGTFEDRIDELITAKKKLMEETIAVDDQLVVKMLNRQELIQLLRLE